jgi:hypothetical protein
MSTLSRRDQMAVSSAALSSAPWRTAALTGAVVGAGDLGLSLIGGHIGLAMLSGPVSLGALVFFTVAAVGSLFGARGNPWKFALAPALACAAVVLPVALVLGGSGIFSAVFSAFWHGIVVFGLTGAAGSLRRRPAAE